MNIFNTSLTKRYIPAVSLIAIFIIVTNILNTNSINSNKEYGKIINISGKQRMLSQKLVILGLNYMAHKNKHSQKELENAILEINSSHQYLLTKVFTKKLSNIYYKENLDLELKKYINNFKKLLLTHEEQYLHKARISSNTILKKLDRAVKEYEKYANQQLGTILDLEFYLMIVTLFVLLLEVLFIFKPAAKKLEEDRVEIKNKEEYEKAVIESNNNAIIAIDWTSKITTYNKKAQEIFGWTKEEMLGTRKLLRIIPPKYKDAHTKASSLYLGTGESCGILGGEHELEAIRKDGTIFPIIISFGSKYKPNGSIVVANISDITLKKDNEKKLKSLNESLEQKVKDRTKELKFLNKNLENIVKEKTIQNTKQLEILQQQSKMAQMGEMIGAIAHQWRQPLNELGINIQKLKYNYTSNEINENFIKEFIDKNKKTINFMSKTIDDFRSFFRVNKDKENFSIKTAIEDTIAMQSAQLSNHNIILNIIGNDFNIDSFQSEFQQVVLNLVNNAKDALIQNNVENPTINIILEDNIISIIDNAGGIPSDTINRVFEPYFTTKEQGAGTGMGLYMSKMIIEDNMNGILSVTNTNVTNQNGACFKIKLH